MEKQSIDDSSEIFCSFLFKEGDLNNSDNKLFSKMVIAFVKVDKHAPYDLISEKVFDIDNENYLDELTQQVKQKMDGVVIPVEDFSFNEKIEKFSSDVERHVRLSIIQKQYIMNEFKNSYEIAKDAASISKDALNNAENAKKVAGEYSRKMENVKGNIYTDFISILGIFTAITFATFGGLQLLGNVFGNALSDDNHILGTALVLGSLYIFGTYLLLLALLSGIHKLMRMNNYNDEDNLTNKVQDSDFHHSKKLMRIISTFCLIILAGGTLLIMFF